ncbi:hypothetical protein MKW92_028180, partial [Papaver armeniacum]
VFGSDGKGYVRGMGGEVSKTEILAYATYREQLRIEKLKIKERFNIFEAGSQDNNTAQPSIAASQQNQATRCVLRNLRKKTFAFGRVNFSTSPNDENYEVVVDEIIDEHMKLCVGDGNLEILILATRLNGQSNT